ncbi:hypothetical protein HN51_054158 [Arachis hypogaea]
MPTRGFDEMETRFGESAGQRWQLRESSIYPTTNLVAAERVRYWEIEWRRILMETEHGHSQNGDGKKKFVMVVDNGQWQ